METHIVAEFADSILCLRINRPGKMNAMTAAMYADMAAALVRAADDSAVRVVVVHGESQIFSSGNDLADFKNNPPSGEDSAVFRFMQAISTLPKPVIAAVNGPVVGVGVTMLLHCDLVYAGASARFQLPFVNLALVPELASSLLLPAGLGYQRAAELLMLGEPFSAAQAREYGIVNEVLTDGEEIGAALKTAAKLAAKPPAALRLTKMLMKKGLAQAVAARLREEAGHFSERLRSPEAAEAFKAFFEKRTPDYSKFP